MSGHRAPLALVAMFALATLAGCAGDDPAKVQTANNNPGAGDAVDPGDLRPEETGPHVSEVFAQEQTAGGVVEISRERVYINIVVTGRFPVDAKYEIDRVDAPAGSIINVTLTNQDPNPSFIPGARHGWVIQGVADSSPGTPTTGQTMSREFTTPEEPGEYRFFCPVAYNQERGMEGTFTFT